MSTDSQERRAWFRVHVLPLESELLRLAQRIGPSDVDPQDLVQETFLRLMNTDWRAISSPAAVLRTTLRNIVYDIFRRRGLVPFRRLTDAQLSGVRDQGADPERTLIGVEELRRAATVIAALPPQCRKVFVLRKVHGLSAKAIAEELGISVSTAEKHLARALRLCSEAFARQEQVIAVQERHVSADAQGLASDPRRGGGVGGAVGRAAVGD